MPGLTVRGNFAGAVSHYMRARVAFAALELRDRVRRAMGTRPTPTPTSRTPSWCSRGCARGWPWPVKDETAAQLMIVFYLHI